MVLCELIFLGIFYSKDNEDPVLRDEVTRLIEEEMKAFPEKRDELLSRKGLFLDNEVNDLVSKIEQVK